MKTVNVDIKKTTILSAYNQVKLLSDLDFKRPGTGISPIHYFDFIGKKVKINLKKNTLMSKKFLK